MLSRPFPQWSLHPRMAQQALFDALQIGEHQVSHLHRGAVVVIRLVSSWMAG
jgi:hypothetical protein